MRLRSRPALSTLLKIVLLALAAAPAAAVVDDSAVLRPDGELLVIELSGGARHVVADSPVDRARLHRLVGAWLVTGAQRTEGGSRLVLHLVDDSGLSVEIREPGERAGALRAGAVPIVEHGEWVGLAWLEGSGQRSFEVRAADWDGAGWGEVQVVSGRGPGSQLALTAAVLHDGTWLLAWSAFDGQDDEIVWSRRRAAYWSEPLRLQDDNRVPDITPSLTAVDRGALVAWSQYDGNDYRVVVTRLDGDDWQAPTFVGAPGTVTPTFTAAPTDRLTLLYREVRPAGWSVVELEPSGTVRRQARFIEQPAAASPRSARPQLAPSDTSDSVRLRWPEADREVIVLLEPVP